MIISGATTSKERDIRIDCVKGVLILFIVLEHNTLLTTAYDWIRPVADSIGVGGFILLTFLWPLKTFSLQLFVDKYLSYLIPFLIFLTLTTAANWIMFRNVAILEGLWIYAKAAFLASPFDIKEASGFMYLWFLPCLVALYFIRLIHAKIGSIFLLVALVAFIVVVQLPERVLIKLPFSLHVIGFLYLPALVSAKFYNPIVNSPVLVKFVIGALFLIGCFISTLIGWKFFLAGGLFPTWQEPWLILFYSVLLVITVPSIYIIVSLLPNMVLQPLSLLGRDSLKIYLAHPIIYILLTKILKIIAAPLLSFLVVVALSVMFAWAVNRMPLLNRLMFPSSLSSLRQLKDS
ncbi:MAG: fucose 4-O-acetylase-like acetyltransferase [Gammaproteobacteria bacterium]|jgi:fucose 4-O-acetylase-like acetyltransferase